jgi:Putative phage metallopeptidase
MAKRGRKPKVEKLDWERLYTAEKLVEERIAEHHPHLRDAHILVVGKPKAGKRGDRRIITVSKAVGPELATVLKDQQLGEPQYLIIVGRDVWNGLNTEQKQIELDRALCFFTGRDEKGRWLVQDYEVKTFHRMVDWYGIKHDPDVQNFAKVVKDQLELPGGDAA